MADTVEDGRYLMFMGMLDRPDKAASFQCGILARHLLLNGDWSLRQLEP
ncbi:hypothetical protein T09_15095 [Trichinella sp. T9]|uniref:Uncharacterized protein n=1 Tax=Trichinella murrelli TaxID=144512 RepID=A0A0V0U9Z6_9BILA|nr:hypothetical protein T05_11645 [Trichinella murrelli]KRX65170.1 hypothetical protein T09_15095 [Trichinella sp. T9]